MAFWVTEAMQTNDYAAEKRIVEELTFGAKTTKRVTWEAWEFTVVGPHLVEVTNASYGYLKDEHSYTVGVEARSGLPLPAECDCLADKYHEGYDCKHKVALATVGGPTVMNAAIQYEAPEIDKPLEPESVLDKLRADGGVHAEKSNMQSEGCDCTSLSDLPCWPCYRDGKREV